MGRIARFLRENDDHVLVEVAGRVIGAAATQTTADSSKPDQELKLQNGAHYAEMRDWAAEGGAYTGWACTTALRLRW